MAVCIHCFVSGRVQGVWFRASTQRKAQALNLTGWARNLPDGRVEVMACGEVANIELMYAWLKEGPELAHVTNLTREDLPYQAYPTFETG